MGREWESGWLGGRKERSFFKRGRQRGGIGRQGKVRTKHLTYPPPNAKMPIKSFFLPSLICSCHTKRIGRHKIQILRSVLASPPTKTTVEKLMHVARRALLGFHCASRGTHWKMVVPIKVMAIARAATPVAMRR